MSENLPVNVDDTNAKGTITYASEVIATIVGVATTEVEGVAGMSGPSAITASSAASRSPRCFAASRWRSGRKKLRWTCRSSWITACPFRWSA